MPPSMHGGIHGAVDCALSASAVKRESDCCGRSSPTRLVTHDHVHRDHVDSNMPGIHKPFSMDRHTRGCRGRGAPYRGAGFPRKGAASALQIAHLEASPGGDRLPHRPRVVAGLTAAIHFAVPAAFAVNPSAPARGAGMAGELLRTVPELPPQDFA